MLELEAEKKSNLQFDTWTVTSLTTGKVFGKGRGYGVGIATIRNVDNQAAFQYKADYVFDEFERLNGPLALQMFNAELEGNEQTPESVWESASHKNAYNESEYKRHRGQKIKLALRAVFEQLGGGSASRIGTDSTSKTKKGTVLRVNSFNFCQLIECSCSATETPCRAPCPRP